MGGLVKYQRKKSREFGTTLKRLFSTAHTEAEIVEEHQSESDAVDEEVKEEPSKQVLPGQSRSREEGSQGDSDYISDSEPEPESKDGGGAEIKLEVGLKFDSREDLNLCKMMKRYGAQTKTAFIKRTSSKDGLGQLVYECVHGAKRPSTSRGARPVTKTKKLGCEATICFYTRKLKGSSQVGVTTLTGLSLKHENHPINDSIFKLDTVKIDEKASSIIRQLDGLGCSIPHMRSALKAKKYPVSAGQIRYYLSKFKDSSPQDVEQLKAFLRNVRDTGGSVNILKNKKDNIQAVQVTTAAMKKAYNGCRPDTIQLDTTFNLEEAKYKCSGVLFLNPATNKGELVSISFIVDETSESLRFVLSAFRDISAHRPRAVNIDKDFTEIKILKELFPDTRILLCLFHVPMFIRTKLLSTAAESKEKKIELYELFEGLMHAPDDQEFDKSLKLWEEAVKGVQVRPTTEYVDLEQYFDRNWLNCKEMWAKSSRRGLLISDEHTTCR